MSCVFELEISRADLRGGYHIDVVDSPAGEASATFTMDASGILDGLDDLQQTLLASSVPSRRFLSRSEARVRSVGEDLFAALFSQSSIAELYRSSSAVASERGEALRLVLRLNAPELVALPWESMFDAATSSYVCRREPLVRRIPVASSPPPLKVELPLRILALVSSPRGLAALDVEREQLNLAGALEQPMKQKSVVLHWLERATWANLQDALLTDSWHVVHFIGHGDFDIDRDEGVLALESEEGRLHRVSASDFVDLLGESQPMPRLVVLNACESAMSGAADMFAGTAATLVRGGVASVAAMQFEISDKAAIAFCRGFYSAIGRGRGIDQAVRSGRVAILGTGGGSLEWITPTLYLRGRETQLFTVSRPAKATAPEPTPGPRAESPPAGRHQEAPAGDSQLTGGSEGAEPERETAVVDSGLPAPGHDRSSTGGDDIVPAVYADRLPDLLAAAKRVSWTNRPGKDQLKSLRRALHPDEDIVGCVTLALKTFTSVAVVVTDRYLHIGTSNPDAAAWTGLVGPMPESFKHAANNVRVPLSDIAGLPEIVKRRFVLTLRGQGTLILSTAPNRQQVDVVKEMVAQALGFR